MRASNPKIEPATIGSNTIKSPSKRLLVKQLFSPRAKLRTAATLPDRQASQTGSSTSTLNLRRFSTDSVFSSNISTIGRRLSRDPSFLSNSPPDINSRRSSYLDVVNTMGTLSKTAKSPVLSIENISDCSLSDNRIEMVRKLSDVETIGRKLATLSVDNDLVRRKSDIVISNNKLGSDLAQLAAKSVQNISEAEKRPDEIQLSVTKVVGDDLKKRSKSTIQELQNRLTSGKSNPQIRIEIEDTTKPPVPAKPKKFKQRHKSLSEQQSNKHKKLPSQSQSLDSTKAGGDKTKPPSLASVLRCKEHDLPPAPPPPNCSPRNSNGKSPLERLSKDELVLLWRSSESELRSHLLKALRDKEVDDPP